MATPWALVASKELGAELRLAQAVSEFQSLLSGKEKIEFQAQNVQFSREAPAARDVYRLTAEIDRASELVSGGRVYGPRFMKFLQAVQRFASLGDILVGGSQNLLAGAVWTGVRFALMTTTVRASFISKVSEIFMYIGQSAPRFEELAHLYSESKLLQTHLLEYFIVVVHLCHYIVQCSKQSNIGQFVSSLSDTKLNKFQTQLSTRAQLIKDEVMALTMSLITDEASRSEKFRAWYLGDSKAIAYRRKMKDRAKLLDRCSIYEHESTWKQLRKAGTARFFSDVPEYQEWKSGTVSKALLWSGKIGSGKSVLLASIVDDLYLDQSLSSDTLVTYFFCQWDIAESLKARTILGSLARQVLSAYYLRSSQEPPWSDLSNEGTQLGLDNLVLLIKQAVPKGNRLIFILDGIDECSPSEHTELLKYLALLQSAVRLDLCVSVSTTYEHQSSTRQGLTDLCLVQMLEIPEHNPDIVAFIESTLSQRILDNKLTIGDHVLREEIQDALLRGAQGMMLWVALQIEAICLEKTDSDIRRSLEDLPKTLSEAFERELQRGRQHHNTKYLSRILYILLGSIRPLTLDEFAGATSVELGDTTWDAAKHINDMRSLLKCCGKLVVVDEESMAVRLAHHSIRQHLLSAYLAPDGTSLSDFQVQTAMTGIVVTYLNYDFFERQITMRTADLPAKSVTTSVLARAMRSSTAADLTMKLLQQNNKPSDFDIVKALNKHKTNTPTSDQQVFAFKVYAESYYLDHAWTLLATPYSPMILLFLNIVRRLAAPLLSFVTETTHSSKNPGNLMNISWPSLQGRVTLIALLADRQSERILWLLQDANGENCLDWIAKQNSPELLASFARLCFKRTFPDDYKAARAFKIVLQMSDFDTATYLWENFELARTDMIYSYLMISMIQLEHATAVEWLLQRGTGITTHVNPFQNPLLLPLFKNQIKDLSRDHKYPLLFFAINERSASMTRLLLDYGAPESGLTGDMWPPFKVVQVKCFLLMNGFESMIDYVKRYASHKQSGSSIFTAIAITQFTASGDRLAEMSIAQYDILKIDDINDQPVRNDRQWLLARNEHYQRGLVPADCVVLLTRPSKLPEIQLGYPLTGLQYRCKATAVCSYNGDPNDVRELSLARGDVLDVIALDDAWWQARNDRGQEGIVPSVYLDSEDDVGAVNLHAPPQVHLNCYLESESQVFRPSENILPPSTGKATQEQHLESTSEFDGTRSDNEYEKV